MRHSDPRLTANIYTDVSKLPTFAAVSSLSWISPIEKHATDKASTLPPQIAPQKSATSMQMLARVVTNWGAIPPQIQQAIVAIVENFGTPDVPDLEM